MRMHIKSICAVFLYKVTSPTAGLACIMHKTFKKQINKLTDLQILLTNLVHNALKCYRQLVLEQTHVFRYCNFSTKKSVLTENIYTRVLVFTMSLNSIEKQKREQNEYAILNNPPLVSLKNFSSTALSVHCQ